MLAYLFWHRHWPGVSPEQYERRLVEFHASLARTGLRSASFDLQRLPFLEEPGYEDWYLVEDWTALGALGRHATEGARADLHDALASLESEGWGGIYARLRGAPEPPAGARWTERPRGESTESFLAHEPAGTVWQRQLVLGPAPELCLSAQPSADRRRLWPR
jgi:hypothetical protein